MDKIIGGKRYNTETATMVAEWDNGYSVADFNFCREELYRKKTGEFFLYGEGGGMTKYRKSYGNSFGWGEKITPLTIKEVQKWAEENLDGDEYEEIFKIKEEYNALISALIPMSLRGKLENQSKKENRTMTEIIIEALENHL